MLKEVVLVYHRQKFDNLVEIAKHPVISKRVQSLLFMGDRFKPLVDQEYDVVR